MARAADAKEQYREILENWSSFRDLTGDHVAFVFAGEPVEESPSWGWRNGGRIYKMPDNIYVPQTLDLALEVVPDYLLFQLSPEAPEPQDLYTHPTRRPAKSRQPCTWRKTRFPAYIFCFPEVIPHM